MAASVSGSGAAGAVGFAPVAGFETSAAGSFDLVPEDDDEADETLTVSGSSDLPVDSATVALTDDDAASGRVLTVADAEAVEGAGKMRFEVTLDRPSGTAVSVSYATADPVGFAGPVARAGFDYEAAKGTVSFAPGETSRTVCLAIVDDDLHEEEETFELSLTALVGAAAAAVAATGTIRDEDLAPPTLAGGLPPALLCVGGAPHELDLAEYFGGAELRFSAVSSAPAVATASLTGGRLTAVTPVSKGESSVR